MGQKVDPNGLRTGIIKPWSSKWYADKAHFADNIVEDDKIRKFIKKKYYDNAISKIVIERAADKLVIAIHTAKPAVLIGKAGAGVVDDTTENYNPALVAVVNVALVARDDRAQDHVLPRLYELDGVISKFRHVVSPPYAPQPQFVPQAL